MSRRAPRRKQKSAASRLRPFWLLLLLVAAAAGAGGYYAATWRGFYPPSVSVSGNRVVTTAEIVGKAQISMRSNVWLQNTAAAAARIRAIPYIEDVWIHRTLPARVHIAVTERVPAAIVENRTDRVLADASLRVLQPADTPVLLPVLVSKTAALPPAGGFIRDPVVRRLRDDYVQLHDAHVIVSRLEYDKFGDLEAVMGGGVRLLLGDDADVRSKSELVGPILSQVAAQGRRIAAIDLRAPKAPVVRYR